MIDAAATQGLMFNYTKLSEQLGVPVVPDFVANAGALIQGVSWNLLHERVGPERLQRIGATAGELLDRARAEDVPPSVLALQVARERVARGSLRPWCVVKRKPT